MEILMSVAFSNMSVRKIKFNYSRRSGKAQVFVGYSQGPEV